MVDSRRPSHKCFCIPRLVSSLSSGNPTGTPSWYLKFCSWVSYGWSFRYKENIPKGTESLLLARDVKNVEGFCCTCHTSQVIGKTNQNPPAVPLKPIPLSTEPYCHVMWGPFLKLSRDTSIFSPSCIHPLIFQRPFLSGTLKLQKLPRYQSSSLPYFGFINLSNWTNVWTFCLTYFKKSKAHL